jgi:hypothetical protein
VAGTVACGGDPPAGGTCHSRIFVAIVPTGDCGLDGVVPDGWTARGLFADGSPGLRAWAEPRPTRLARYCVYEAPSSSSPSVEFPPELTQALSSMEGVSVARDCTASVDPSGIADPAVQADFTTALHTAIQRVDGGALATRPAGAVQLVVLDTASEHTPSLIAAMGDQQHGLLMRDIARDVACPAGEAGCAVAISSAVAMPRHAGRRDWVAGGTSGAAVDVAQALVAEVGRWRDDAQATAGAPPRLVLNLSLGWVAADPTSPVEQAVEDTVAFAACNHALVVAAAGNVRSDQAAPGALSPARHQRTPAPDPARCTALGFAPISRGSADASQRPLVVAVGGVDAHDRDIHNARSGSRPPLVAYAEAALPAPGLAASRIPPTGTSAGNAVTAGLAALVWSFDPERSPAAVIRALEAGAWPLGVPAELTLGDHPVDTRRVSVCGTLEAIGELPDAACPRGPAPGRDRLRDARSSHRAWVLRSHPTRRF